MQDLDEVLVGVQRVSRRPGYRQRLFANLDLPGGLSGFRVLRAVERVSAPGPSIGDLAKLLTVDPSTASRAVERCLAGGLLVRRPRPEDRRRVHLELTDAGVELLAQTNRNRRDVFAEVVEGWADEDLERLIAMLHELLDGLDRLEGH